MFSGIIQFKVKPIKVLKAKNSLELTFPTPKKWKVEIGESININGVCSTVKDLNPRSFTVYYMSETLGKTNLNFVTNENLFNLERSLTLNSLIGGHLVSGHIDTTGEIIKVIKKSDSTILEIKLPQIFSKYLIYKGSVAVNGVSLTVVSTTKTHFTVSLIPHTLKESNLGNLKKGDLVNLEVDTLAKYIEKLIKK